MKFETLAIQSTAKINSADPAVATPIVLSTTFERHADGSYPSDYIYTRHGNPNRAQLEHSMALLEGGISALAFASGMAATAAVLQSLKFGDHILLPNDAYYTNILLAESVFTHWGLQFDCIDMGSIDTVIAAIKPNTALIWMETPSNPMLQIVDIEAIANTARSKNILTVVDNTWASPVWQNPLLLGADIVMHSCTKYIGGHSDVLGGVLVFGKADNTYQKLKNIQKVAGAVPSPFDCWLLSRGIKTLAVRVKAQTETTKALVTFLNNHQQVEKVYYPGLASHINHDIAQKQMKDFGAMFSFCVKGGQDEAFAFLAKLKLFTIATSLGSVESLIEHRKSVEGPNSQTPPNLLRVSVGLEHAEDLMADLSQALG